MGSAALGSVFGVTPAIIKGNAGIPCQCSFHVDRTTRCYPCTYDTFHG